MTRSVMSSTASRSTVRSIITTRTRSRTSGLSRPKCTPAAVRPRERRRRWAVHQSSHQDRNVSGLDHTRRAVLAPRPSTIRRKSKAAAPRPTALLVLRRDSRRRTDPESDRQPKRKRSEPGRQQSIRRSGRSVEHADGTVHDLRFQRIARPVVGLQRERVGEGQRFVPVAGARGRLRRQKDRCRRATCTVRSTAR